MSVVEGVDVSKWQGTIDWTKLAEARSFVIMRATTGLSTDSKFATNWSGAGDSGIIRGAYHAANPSEDAKQQADNFASAVGGWTAGEIVPALDLEQKGGLSHSALRTWTQTFLEETQAAFDLGDRLPLIYLQPWFWKDVLEKPSFLDPYPLWEAKSSSASAPPPMGSWVWTFWQYGTATDVPGIDAKVDTDRFNGDLAALQAFVGS